MAGDNDHLLRMFGSFPVGNDVKARRIRQRLRRECQVKFDWSLAGQILQQFRILGCDRGSRNLCYPRGIFRHAGVRNAEIRTAYRAHQDGSGSGCGCEDRSCAAIDDSIAVCVQTVAIRRKFFIKLVVEE